jgi:hypothetical protein
MVQGKARPISSTNPSEIAVGIFSDASENPVDVLREPVPEGFPPELVHHLADYLARGFNAAVEEDPLAWVDEFLPKYRRPIDDETQREGYEGAKLRKEGFTYGEIAHRICRHLNNPAHRCGKKCADRIRQAVKQYHV